MTTTYYPNSYDYAHALAALDAIYTGYIAATWHERYALNRLITAYTVGASITQSEINAALSVIIRHRATG